MTKLPHRPKYLTPLNYKTNNMKTRQVKSRHDGAWYQYSTHIQVLLLFNKTVITESHKNFLA